MKYKVTSPATSTMTTLAELKTHLLLFGDTSYDDELEEILFSAEEVVSEFLGEYLAPTTVRVNITSFDDTRLPHKSVSGVAVRYWDANHSAQYFSNGNYRLDESGDYPILKYLTQPTGRSTTSEYAGHITYDTSMDVLPKRLKRAVLLIAADLFEHRNDSIEKRTEKVQLSAMRLLQPLRGW